jgi:hypothetical protein
LLWSLQAWQRLNINISLYKKKTSLSRKIALPRCIIFLLYRQPATRSVLRSRKSKRHANRRPFVAPDPNGSGVSRTGALAHRSRRTQSRISRPPTQHKSIARPCLRGCGGDATTSPPPIRGEQHVEEQYPCSAPRVHLRTDLSPMTYLSTTSTRLYPSIYLSHPQLHFPSTFNFPSPSIRFEFSLATGSTAAVVQF